MAQEQEAGGKALRVLVVEDDEEDVLILRDMLRELSPERPTFVVAKRLVEALEWVEEERFDVVLLDLRLPDSQGLETFFTLNRRAPSLPVVVLTALDDSDLARRAVQAGAQDYLVKGQVTAQAVVRSVLYAMERQRTTRYQRLLLERERFATAVSQMSDAIVVTDGNGRLTNANHAACLLLHIPEQEVNALTLADVLAPFHTSVPVADLLACRERVSAFEISRPNTSPPLYLDARITRLFDDSGALGSMVLMVRDVTDERHQRNVQADFLLMVSHKLRTPLAVLLGWLEVCDHIPAERLAREWPRVGEVLKGEVAQLSAMVQRLLEFKALTTQDLAASSRPVNLEDIARSVVDRVRARYPYKTLEVEYWVSGSPYVQASDWDASFVLEQLLDNAAKFGDKEPVRITVRIGPAVGRWLKCAVSDNGPGIPHEYFDRVFRGFVQVEDHVTGSVPGLGVGLHMARTVVTAYGGKISVESEIGRGATFTFTLPAADQDGPRDLMDNLPAG
jgi:PAS domain S-box-containing protein